ncbi:MAG: hypothetical protein HRU03_03870 [Nanoarchaeales archaeon]|nr:hypothetical protein [Nanoarchaeales archaeon]
MEDTMEQLGQVRRHLSSIEHMIFVSCKFTRTTEMLRKVMETLVTGYEHFFALAYTTYVGDEELSQATAFHKIQILTDTLVQRGIEIDLSDYFLLKKLLLSEYDSIGEYRKNLCMVSYIDGEEYVINTVKIHEFYARLKEACASLNAVNV